MIDIMGGAGMTGQQSFSEQNKNQWQTVSQDNETSNNKTLSTSTPPLQQAKNKLNQIEINTYFSLWSYSR